MKKTGILILLLFSVAAYSQADEQDCITFGDSFYTSNVETTVPVGCSDLFKTNANQSAISETESLEIKAHGYKNMIFTTVYNSLLLIPAFENWVIAGEKTLLFEIEAIELNEIEKKVLVLQSSNQSIMTYKLDIGGKIHPHKKLIVDDLTSASNIALDLVNNQIAVIHKTSAKLTFYHKDACVDGRIAEFSTAIQRTLSGALTNINSPVDACISISQNKMYIYDETSKQIHIFDSAAAGNIAPTTSKTPVLGVGQIIEKIDCYETSQKLILTDQTGATLSIDY